jgi:membrane protein DedA with SNARE-associated domain
VLTASVTSSITTFIGNHGVYAVFALLALDAVFPAASELVMLYAGALAAGTFSADVVLFGHTISTPFWAFLAMALAGTVGYVLGSIVGWAIGNHGGRPYLERHGRWLHLGPANLDRAEAWFERYGDWAVLLGRVTPVVRSFISIPAGVFRAPFARYTWLTLLGSAVWCFTLAGIGWALGKSYTRFHHDFAWVEYVVIAGVVFLVGYLILSRLARRRAPDTAG